jgi:hypothetical protein
MITYGIVLAVALVAQPEIEPSHRGNTVYARVLSEGLKADGKTFVLPVPRLLDGQAAEEQRAALATVAGSERGLEEMFRDSVTAPHIIKVHDHKTADATIRAAELWFVVYGDFHEIDPVREAARTDQKEVEAGNMWFQSRLLKPQELRAVRIEPAPGASGINQWYAHLHARLLDRIEIEVTNHVMATQSSESIVVASQTDSAFAQAKNNGNFWISVAKTDGTPAEGAAHPYPGGISFAKMSRVKFKPGAILVETHMAFVEPVEWFQGAPILRSKFSVVAQDQIRTLRREIARRRNARKG